MYDESETRVLSYISSKVWCLYIRQPPDFRELGVEDGKTNGNGANTGII